MVSITWILGGGLGEGSALRLAIYAGPLPDLWGDYKAGGGGKVEVAQGGGGRTILLAFVLILKVNRFILNDWESTEKHKEES